MVTFAGTLANGTIQSEEPIPPIASAVNASVWWSWTAGQSGPTTIEVLNFSTNNFKLGVIAVWSGTDFSTGFNLIAMSSLNVGRHPFFTFSAVSRTTYHFQVVGTNAGDFTLKITETNIPLIMVQPIHRTVGTNGSTFLGIVAAGTPPLFYQWQFNGTNLPGETFPILSLDHLSTNQSGDYSVTVSNAAGVATSDIAVLNVKSRIAPPQLMAVGSSAGEFNFRILGDAYAYYRIDSSTNLADWSEEQSFPKDFVYYRGREKNGVVYNQGSSFAVPQDSSRKFYRSLIYEAANEVCVNNLRKIRFAQEVWTLENSSDGLSAISVSDLAVYFRNGFPRCPLGPPECETCSYILQTADQNPRCAISQEHILEEPEF